MMPEEIAQMPNDECLALIRGLRPFKVKKYPLESHPNYKYSGGANKNNNFEIKKRPELLIKDNVTLQDIKREIKKSQMNRIIGKPQNAVTGILEAFNTTLDTEANDYLKSKIQPAPISAPVTNVEPQEEVVKEEQVYHNNQNHEFDDAPVHTITEKNMKNSEREIRNKKNYNNKNHNQKKHNKNNNYHNKNNNYHNKNNNHTKQTPDIEDMIDEQIDFNINNMIDDVMDDDFN